MVSEAFRLSSGDVLPDSLLLFSCVKMGVEAGVKGSEEPSRSEDIASFILNSERTCKDTSHFHVIVYQIDLYKCLVYPASRNDSHLASIF